MSKPPELIGVLSDGARELVAMVLPYMEKTNADVMENDIAVETNDGMQKFRVTFKVQRLPVKQESPAEAAAASVQGSV